MPPRLPIVDNPLTLDYRPCQPDGGVAECHSNLRTSSNCGVTRAATRLKLINAISSLLRGGASPEEIANAWGYSAQTIYRDLRRIGDIVLGHTGLGGNPVLLARWFDMHLDALPVARELMARGVVFSQGAAVGMSPLTPTTHRSMTGTPLPSAPTPSKAARSPFSSQASSVVSSATPHDPSERRIEPKNEPKSHDTGW